jgi:hypothetical protein
MNWTKLKDQYPIAVESGCWDGLRSSELLVKTMGGKYCVVRMYKGIIDGQEFCDFYDQNDFDIAHVESWVEID